MEVRSLWTFVTIIARILVIVNVISALFAVVSCFAKVIEVIIGGSFSTLEISSRKDHTVLVAIVTSWALTAVRPL